ncbi:MAG: hypothetical protein J7M18_00310 [Candidatus Eremiobacteraeota bacterium]|nr:hypothetical protein [Candidatus Eremiobacteraeota bacterium]
MKLKNLVACIFVLTIIVVSCTSGSKQSVVLKNYTLNNTEGIITKSGVAIDSEVSSDGKGSLKITMNEPVIIRLFETDDMDIDNARLIYQAKVKMDNLESRAYLEM